MRLSAPTKPVFLISLIIAIVTLLSVLDVMNQGRSSVVEAACTKLSWTETGQRIARAAMDFGAPEAVLKGGRVEMLWRQSMWETIGGGTSEIMRGLIAKQALGLSART